MKANLQTYRQSPRKVRLVADAIRGKKVSDALVYLNFIRKRAADVVKKLLESAAANARNKEGHGQEELIVASIAVDKGATIKRSMPRARGRGARINKRTSHIKITLKQI